MAITCFATQYELVVNILYEERKTVDNDME